MSNTSRSDSSLRLSSENLFIKFHGALYFFVVQICKGVKRKVASVYFHFAASIGHSSGERFIGNDESPYR